MLLSHKIIIMCAAVALSIAFMYGFRTRCRAQHIVPLLRTVLTWGKTISRAHAGSFSVVMFWALMPIELAFCGTSHAAVYSRTASLFSEMRELQSNDWRWLNLGVQVRGVVRLACMPHALVLL